MSEDVKHIPKISFSFPEASQATSISRSALYAAAKDGRLRVTKVGGRSVILTEDLRTFLTGGAGHV